MLNATEKLKKFRIDWIKENVRGTRILDIGPIGGGGSFFAHEALKNKNNNSRIIAFDLLMNKNFKTTTGTPSQ